jgi:GT2 family glycosyltransferase
MRQWGVPAPPRTPLPLSTRLLREARRLLASLRRLPLAVSRWLRPLAFVPPAIRAAIADPVRLGRSLAEREWPSPTGTPEVSVIIPVYNQLAFTLVCLHAILETRELTSFEILVVDDGSSDGTAALLPTLPGLRYLRNPENLGFVGSCNRGAAEARGAFLYFLNNDTAVLPGWLDRLRQAFRDDDRLGLAGARLVHPDGRLQEAGARVFRGGEAARRGAGEYPGDPRFAYRIEADYCSGAAILVPAALFREVGGFASRYAPAYYEDTDLAFAIRRLGLRVDCCPAATVIHWDGVTAGRDKRRGVKAYQVRNAERFRERWWRALARLPAMRRELPFVPERRRSQSALVIDTTTPRPDRDSGSIDMDNLLRLLQGFGYHVVFAPRDLARAGPFTSALQARGIECLHRPSTWSIGRFLRQRGGEFTLVVLTRPKAGRRFLDLARARCPRARIIYYTVDLHYLRYQRHAEATGRRSRAAQAASYRRLELGIIGRADVSLVLSPVEAARIERDLPGASTAVLPLLRDVAGQRLPGPEGRRGMLFVGGFGHHPNADAVGWFLDQILPLVRAEAPDLVFHVVGGGYPASLRSTAGSRVVFHGQVSDLAPLYASARMVVAPLRFGAGMKGKVVESMLQGVPCVTTTVGAEGFGAEPGRELMVADDAAAFARAVLRVEREDELWERLSSRARALAEREFSLEANGHRLARILANAGAEPFAGACTLCGHAGPYALEPTGGRTPRRACAGCGATPWMWTLARELPGDGPVLAVRPPPPLAAVGQGRWAEAPGAAGAPEGPFAAVLCGAERLEGSELAELARRLAPEGRLLWAPRYDPRSGHAPPAGGYGRELLPLLAAHGLDGEPLPGAWPGDDGRVAWSCWRS